MSRTPPGTFSSPVEALHALALGTAALGLLAGLVSGRVVWVNVAVSLLLLLPPLRLATSIVGEARGGRHVVALMGLVVLAFLLISRLIS